MLHRIVIGKDGKAICATHDSARPGSDVELMTLYNVLESRNSKLPQTTSWIEYEDTTGKWSLHSLIQPRVNPPGSAPF